jgi:hypothetical protein
VLGYPRELGHCVELGWLTLRVLRKAGQARERKRKEEGAGWGEED